MSASNHTEFLNLSIFSPSDRPTPLIDYNGDMRKIDSFAKSAHEQSVTAIDDSANALDKATKAYDLSKEVHDNAVKAAADAADAKTLATEALEVATNTADLSERLSQWAHKNAVQEIWRVNNSDVQLKSAFDVHLSNNKKDADFQRIIRGSIIELTYFDQFGNGGIKSVLMPFMNASLTDWKTLPYEDTAYIGAEYLFINRDITMKVDDTELIISFTDSNVRKKQVLAARGSGEPVIRELDIDIDNSRLVPFSISIIPQS